VDNELHFKTGIMGRLAWFFDKTRSCGDPYEATLVLPAILIISVIRLNEVHKVSDLAATVVLVAASLGAGAWMGACVGMERGLRASIRGLSAGAIEGAALAALNDALHQALANASADIPQYDVLLDWPPCSPDTRRRCDAIRQAVAGRCPKAGLVVIGVLASRQEREVGRRSARHRNCGAVAQNLEPNWLLVVLFRLLGLSQSPHMRLLMSDDVRHDITPAIFTMVTTVLPMLLNTKAAPSRFMLCS
jgi:hypothetical protein